MTAAIRMLDKLSLYAMAIGVGLMLQPWWPGGFRTGFFLTLISTATQIIASHLL
jgi:hypothetical protein